VRLLFGPNVLEASGIVLSDGLDLGRLADYRTRREPDFRLEFVGSPLPECERLPRDSSFRDARSCRLLLRFAGWCAIVDLRARQVLAHIPKRRDDDLSMFDNLLRMMAQLVPLISGSGVAIHAAALAFDGRAVAIAAPAGTGKSTASVRALAYGATLLAEDVTIVGDLDGQPAVFTSPLPNACGIVAGPRAVPLSRVYGLHRAPDDRVANLLPGEAFAVLRRNVAIGTREPFLVAEALRRAAQLVENPGVARLDCSLSGDFWNPVIQDTMRAQGEREGT
jgi:hypothetical protein